MLPVYRVLFLVCLLLTNFKSFAGIEKITWYVNDAPPFFILNGEHQGRGICDVVTDHLIQALPHLKHEKLELPHSRISVSLSQGNKACFPCVIHRQQDNEVFIYSKPQLVYPPHRLIARTEQKTKLIELFGDPIDLEGLLISEDHIFAYHGGRKFDENIQSLIDAKVLRRNELIIRNQGGSTTSIFEILQLGRADYTIEYPAIAQYFNANQQKPLEMLPIKQNLNQKIYGAVGCSASASDEFGVRATKAINAAMSNIINKPSYQQNVSHWFNIPTEKYQAWMMELTSKHYPQSVIDR